MKTFEQLKAEAIALGIVPGVVIKCVVDNHPYLVGPYSEWRLNDYGCLVVADFGKPRAYNMRHDHWAEVIPWRNIEMTIVGAMNWNAAM